MKIFPNSNLKRFNQDLAKELATKYVEQVSRTPLDYDSKEKLAHIVSQCGDEYLKRSKGTNNFFELRELLKHLYKNIVVRIHNNAQ